VPLQEPLTKLGESLQRVAEKGGSPELSTMQRIIERGLAQTAELWEPIRRA